MLQHYINRMEMVVMSESPKVNGWSKDNIGGGACCYDSPRTASVTT